ncbi:hypothetical protein EDI_204770 [Entamoeba dispar SAW760]|uniref:Uncharacterized protein n=1 Tax=Entamoeba dispar (strain ATCC PRA-260 / SAW760) TaxID=370354 RepID=B0E827_ENTDS|nr:uncharacterized protein EDI_204770 [Entamoeba dispar SAW760]EDR29315.1 hypothetical protein EDI_204770 [Entamoeba dispar SAW760]|eukprot:EDR29315.1 hypothetical protein EDI_204770 [Entamoeba dispar SAW760]
MEFKNHTPPPLRTDLLTKFKQMIIALPNTSYVLGDHFDEIFGTTSLEVFLTKLKTVFGEFVNNKSVDESKRKEIIDSFEFYADRLLDLYTLSYEGNEEEMKNYSHLSLGRLPKKEDLLSNFDASLPSKRDIPSYSSVFNETKQENQPTLPALLLKKISEADSDLLKKVVEIISPTNSCWNCQIFLEDLSDEVVDKLVELFDISPSEYCGVKND